MVEAKPIDTCPHRDFYHWAGETRHDHLCVGCSLRVTYYLDSGHWEVADIAASLREHPFIFTNAETRRAFDALRRVMARKRLPAPFIAP